MGRAAKWSGRVSALARARPRITGRALSLLVSLLRKAPERTLMRGFSLVELLAALAIVSLLLALAMPAYHGHIVRAKRVQGQAALLRLMQQQERYYTQNNRYLAFSAASPAPQLQQFPWWSGDGPVASAASSAYEIEALACTESTLVQCVLLRALPGTSKVDGRYHDAECGVLSLASTGQRGSSGPASHCWP
jgi:type IV pilus assembly protein PilE